MATLQERCWGVIPAAGIALLAYADSVVTAESLARPAGYDIDADQEFFGLGMASIFSGFFQGFPVNGSQTRSVVLADSGARTQMSGLISSVLVVITLLLLTPAFEIKAKMQDKYRQICKFVEIFDSLIRKMQDSANLRVVDMGAGKGYLTFAIYDYLTRQLQGDATVLGIESRDELVDNCNAVARRVGYERLSFQCGTIDDTDVSGADVLVALHACDTATDDAIFKGISAGAELIICAPCCHKQLRGQLRASNDLTAILKHGILCERQAEILTDGIRALLLQASGYKARVFEFIMPTHTAKNVMIVGEKLASPPDPATALQQIAAIKAGYGIEHHHLETLLGL